MRKYKAGIITVCIGIGICLLLAAGGCQGEEAKKEPITLIIKTPPLTISGDENSDMTESYQLLEKAGEDFASWYDKADVTVKVVKYNYVDEQEYIMDCFETENAADILIGEYFNIASYVYTGKVVPLDDILTKELEEDFREEDLTMGKLDGKTYMLPYFRMQNTLCYNKELFRQCGLDEFVGSTDAIQSWTLEEWDMILQTLSEKLPAMHYPMMMYAKNDQGDTHLMTLLRSHGSSFFDENRKIHINTPEGIAALQWIRDGYENGYFPPGCENMELTDCVELFNNDQLAICMTNNAMYMQEDMPKIGMVNFPSMDGKGLCTSFVTGFQVFDNGNDKKLQAAKDFLAFFYGKDKYLKYEQIGDPSNKSVFEGSRSLKEELKKYQENDAAVIHITESNPNWHGSDSCVRNIFSRQIYAMLSGKQSVAETAKKIDNDCNAAIEAITVKLHE